MGFPCSLQNSMPCWRCPNQPNHSKPNACITKAKRPNRLLHHEPHIIRRFLSSDEHRYCKAMVDAAIIYGPPLTTPGGEWFTHTAAEQLDQGPPSACEYFSECCGICLCCCGCPECAENCCCCCDLCCCCEEPTTTGQFAYLDPVRQKLFTEKGQVGVPKEKFQQPVSAKNSWHHFNASTVPLLPPLRWFESSRAQEHIFKASSIACASCTCFGWPVLIYVVESTCTEIPTTQTYCCIHDGVAESNRFLICILRRLFYFQI
jgi:hypothetical protein